MAFPATEITQEETTHLTGVATLGLKGAGEVVQEMVEEACEWLAGGFSASVRLS